MKRIYNVVFLLSLTLFIFSCAENTSEKKEAYNKLYHQVLDIHDEVMPKMADIPELSKQLQTIADTSASTTKYQQAEKKLQKADKLMMDWMHSFSDEFVKNKAEIKKMNNEQLQKRIEALQTELKEVKKMQQQIDSSIENAEELTKK